MFCHSFGINADQFSKFSQLGSKENSVYKCFITFALNVFLHHAPSFSIYEYSRLVVTDLPWLHAPVIYHITYKRCLTTRKTLHTADPAYLSELINHSRPPRALRPSNTNLPVRSFGNFTSRAFSAFAPSARNSRHLYRKSVKIFSIN